MKQSFLLIGISLFTLSLSGQEHKPAGNDRTIEFPDIPGYRSLVCDFHMHTVFSDGNVWPSIRVEEALRDGLDAISITDHIEYQPHREDIPHPDRNRTYELARKAAGESDLLIIPGAEITRSMPPGHFNALFVEDVNQLMDRDPLLVFREAKRQGAYVFWNHPHWTAQQPDGVAAFQDLHRQLLAEGLFQGIEVYNELTFSEEAVELAREHHLTMMGNSDMHGLIDWMYDVANGGHRPVTLVFATEKTPEALKEALFDGRTAVWFDNTLVGKASVLTPLVEASLKVEKIRGGLVPALEITNHSDADYILENASDFGLHNHAGILVLKAHQTTLVEVKTREEMESFTLRFRVLNAFDSPHTHPEIELRVD
ncbi:MAG: Sb-PDE family phosphodiesterase [Bacteroidales bacterium]